MQLTNYLTSFAIAADFGYVNDPEVGRNYALKHYPTSTGYHTQRQSHYLVKSSLPVLPFPASCTSQLQQFHVRLKKDHGNLIFCSIPFQTFFNYCKLQCRVTTYVVENLRKVPNCHQSSLCCY